VNKIVYNSYVWEVRVKKLTTISLRFLLIHAFLFVAMLSFPLTANGAECPSDWGYKVPELKFETKVKSFGQFQQLYYTSSLGRSKSGGLIGKNPQLFSPDIQTKIDSLGSNVAVNTSYKSTTKSFVQSKYNGGYGDWSEFGYPDTPSWILLWLGISNGTKVHFEMNIAQKGCADLKVISNSYVFSNIPTSEYGFDRYFESFPKGGTSKVLNFQEREIVKKSILDNIESVQNNGRANEIVSLKTVRSLAGYGADYLIVGLSPGGCATGRTTNASPTVNPEDVEVLSYPCKFGVLMPIEVSGGGFTLISSHSTLLNSNEAAEAEAAAELKETQEAEARAAAELKVKQDAAADKAALVKAQSELLAANAALTDSQKVNRELQTKLNSVEAQFKLLSDSISVIQGQVSQLNSKLVVAVAGQNAANAKLKKVCSAKPKPKGC
jgi:hypothetical protein